MSNARAMRLVGLCIALAAGPLLQGCLDTSDDPALREAHEQCGDIENTPNSSQSQPYTIGQLGTISNTDGLPDAAVLLQLLNGMINSSVISGMLNKIPDRMEFNLGGKVSAERDFGACKLGYTVGATLDQCNGLNSIQMTTKQGVVGQNQAGEVIATVPMVIAAGPVACSGTACARGEACGVNLRAAASVTPTLSISNATVEVAMKVVHGTGAKEGKLCFQAEGVAISGVVPNWANFAVNFNGLAFDIPESALQTVWDRLQLPQVVETFNTQITDLLQQQMNALDTCVTKP